MNVSPPSFTATRAFPARLARLAVLPLLASAFLALSGAAPAAAFPGYINYQGKLADIAGNPLTGTYSFRFKLYSNESGGSPVFTDANYTGATPVSVTNGVYSVQIGSMTAGGIPVSAFFNSEVWLETDVNAGINFTGSETLSPRERLTASPFAFLASNAKYLGTGVATAAFTDGGNLQVTYGVTAGTFTATSSMTASAFFGDGSHLTGIPSTASISGSYVAKAGDTMTGALVVRNSAAASPLTVSTSATASVVALYVDATNRVGIGTVSPTGKVSSLAAAPLPNFVATTPGLFQDEKSTYTWYSTFHGTADNGPRRTADISAGYNGANWGTEYLSFGVGNGGAANDSAFATLEKMRIQSNGNVGIGTPSPSQRLDVRAGSYSNNQDFGMQFGLPTGQWLSSIRIKSNESGVPRTTIDATDGTVNGTTNEAVSISVGGKVGISTANPVTTLDVNGDAQFGTGAAKSTFTAAGALTLAGGQGIAVSGGGQLTGLPATPVGATAAASKAYVDSLTGGTAPVQLQAATPGTQQTGHLHISGTGVFDTSVVWGTARTEDRNDAGAWGAGVNSGFYQSAAPAPAANWPAGTSGWWHLLDVRHTNTANNHAMQFAGSFFDQNLYFRKTGDLASASWSQVIMANSAGDVGIGTTAPTNRLHIASGTIAGSPPWTSAALTVKDTRATTAGVGGGMIFEGLYNSGYSTFGGIRGSKLNSTGTDYFGTLDLFSRSGGVRIRGDVPADIDNFVPHLIVAPGGNVGIGTAGPTAKLNIVDQNNAGWFYSQYNDLDGANLRNVRARGTIASPSAVLANDRLVALLAGGYHSGGAFSGQLAGISIHASENFTDTAQGTHLVFVTSLNGSTIAQVERMRIDNAGNVGIGTAEPAAQLSVSGSGQTAYDFSTTGSLAGALDLDDTNADAGNGGALVFSAAAQNWKFAAIKGYLTNGASNSQGDIIFGTRRVATDAALTQTLRIYSTGKVGIGPVIPNSTLHIAGSANNSLSNISEGFLTLSNAGGTTIGDTAGIAFKNSWESPAIKTAIASTFNGGWSKADLRFALNSADDATNVNPDVDTKMTITNAGKVGIGTTNPSANLQVSVPAGNAIALIESAAGSAQLNLNSAAAAYPHILFTQGGVGRFEMGQVASNGNFYFNNTTQGGEAGAAMVITKTGKVGIGTTNPLSKLSVGGDGFINNGIYGQGTNIGVVGSGAYGVAGYGTAGGDAVYGYNSGAGRAGYFDSVSGYALITGRGNVGIGAPVPGYKLDVQGGDVNTSGKLRENGNALIPAGAVMSFNLASCPAGWTALAAAEGRYLVGLPSAGTLAGTAGTALGDLEDRATGAHSHGINDPGHAHSFPKSGTGGIGGLTYNATAATTGSQVTNVMQSNISIFPTGVAGTNAPYLQLLVCQKN